MRRLASEVIRELEMRITRLEREASEIKPGDTIMLKKDALQLHSRKSPASAGYSSAAMDYRNALSKLQGQELTVKFVHSNSYVAQTPVGSIDVPKYMAEKVENLRMAADREPDMILARDIALSVGNDSRIYYRMIKPNIANLAKKMANGKYQKDLAVKAMMNIITAYLPQYKNDAGNRFMTVNKATKEEAAKELLEQYEKEIQDESEKEIQGQSEELKGSKKKASRRRYF